MQAKKGISFSPVLSVCILCVSHHSAIVSHLDSSPFCSLASETFGFLPALFVKFQFPMFEFLIFFFLHYISRWLHFHPFWRRPPAKTMQQTTMTLLPCSFPLCSAPETPPPLFSLHLPFLFRVCVNIFQKHPEFPSRIRTETKPQN